MGAYRERLLKEGYGGASPAARSQPQEEPSGFLTAFKLRFSVCLILFGGFAYLSLTGGSFLGVTADQIVTAVEEDELYREVSGSLSKLGLYE
ncbi:MAG: hypothetical protein Q4C82_07315 [Eubacteriales bacterium]|nr:hypothetical protein [Eubacteriales bacterium]